MVWRHSRFSTRVVKNGRTAETLIGREFTTDSA